MRAASLFTQAYAPYLVLGVGRSGGRAAATACLEGLCDEVPWAACDTHPARLLATGLRRKLLIPLSEKHPVQAASSQLHARKEELLALAEHCQVAVLMGALGEPAVDALLPALVHALREAGIVTYVVGAEPLAFEGPSRGCAAEAVVAAAAHAADGFFWLPARGLAANLNDASSTARASQSLESALASAAQTLLAAFVGTNHEPGWSTGRLRSALRGGGRIHAALGTACGPGAAYGAVEAACASCWLPGKRETDSYRMAVALCAGDEISIAEVAAIKARLEETRLSPAPALLGLGVDASLGDEARCLVLLLPATGGNVVPITQE